MLRRFAPVFLLVLALGVPSFPAADALAADKLVVWWNKGYYPEEDAAMQKIVKEFEATHKAEVDLSFTAQEDLLKKITAALIAHRVPTSRSASTTTGRSFPSSAGTISSPTSPTSSRRSDPAT